jgi:hypothetical protein
VDFFTEGACAPLKNYYFLSLFKTFSVIAIFSHIFVINKNDCRYLNIKQYQQRQPEKSFTVLSQPNQRGQGGNREKNGTPPPC